MKLIRNSQNTLTMLSREDKLMEQKLAPVRRSSRKMNILVVQHVSYESSGVLFPYFKKLGHKISHLKLYQKNARFSKDLFKNDLFVFMGGPMSVNHEAAYPYLIEENKFIQELISKDKCILGICLGSQLVAKALGAKVYRTGKKEIGWYQADLTKAALQDKCLRSLKKEGDRKLRVFQWHGETFDLPKKAVRLASSRLFPNQAFRYGKRIYALQFHLEMNRNLVKRWLVQGQREINEWKFCKSEIEQKTDLYLKSMQKNVKLFVDEMLELA